MSTRTPVPALLQRRRSHRDRCWLTTRSTDGKPFGDDRDRAKVAKSRLLPDSGLLLFERIRNLSPRTSFDEFRTPAFHSRPSPALIACRTGDGCWWKQRGLWRLLAGIHRVLARAIPEAERGGHGRTRSRCSRPDYYHSRQMEQVRRATVESESPVGSRDVPFAAFCLALVF
jgi:hypothetical protein